LSKSVVGTHLTLLENGDNFQDVLAAEFLPPASFENWRMSGWTQFDSWVCKLCLAHPLYLFCSHSLMSREAQAYSRAAEDQGLESWQVP
jgi:hypothetical protein